MPRITVEPAELLEAAAQLRNAQLSMDRLQAPQSWPSDWPGISRCQLDAHRVSLDRRLSEYQTSHRNLIARIWRASIRYLDADRRAVAP